jgi:hypothetical protein
LEWIGTWKVFFPFFSSFASCKTGRLLTQNREHGLPNILIRIGLTGVVVEKIKE